jgi:hypothetical protein
MQSVVSIRPSSASTPHDLYDDVMCTTRSHASTSLEVRLGNTSPTSFHVNQAARSRRVSCVDLPLLALWRNRQIKARLVLMPKPRNHRGDFEAQITKSELLVLRPKLENRRPWF